MAKPPIPADQLEKAFDSVVAKLHKFQGSLGDDEHIAFMEIMKAARTHAASVQARDEGDPMKIDYMKPVQVHSTSAMKDKMKRLAAQFTRGRSKG